jgi:hypothetical protein
MQPPEMALSVNSRDVIDVDTILDRAITAGDPLIAAEFGNQLSNTITLKGIALAKLFFGLRNNWALFRASGIEEDFGDFIDAHMQVSGQTAEKYANMYEAVFINPQIPQELKGQLAHKPIQSLLLLTAAVREGSLDSEDLEDVVVLDHNGIRAKVREARGDVTSSRSAIYARLVQRESAAYPKGTIVVFSGEGNSEAIGYLKLEPNTEAGQRYLERMKNVLGLEDIR